MPADVEEVVPRQASAAEFLRIDEGRSRTMRAAAHAASDRSGKNEGCDTWMR